MKTQSQENFPVASLLFPRRYRKIITDYYNFARECDDTADNPQLTKEEKLQLLNEAEQALYGKSDTPATAVRLRHNLLAENLDFSPAADLLTAFRTDAENPPYHTWAQLLEYCRFSAAPVGRFMLALFNENPSTYLPASALCAVLQITNHLQDLHDDYTHLGRLYLPEELMRQYKISAKALSASKCSKNLQNLLNDILNRCSGLLKDARILPAIIKNRRLKIYVCITLALTDILINKLYHTDILAVKVRLSAIDKISAVFTGVYKAMTTRRKTLTNEGL